MKLNTGIIAQALPTAPMFLCGQPDHRLILSDVRFLLTEKSFYSGDILYFSEWEKLKTRTGDLPVYIFCVGGGNEAANFFKLHEITGIVDDNEDPLVAFSIIQSVFLQFNQLEDNLTAALKQNAPTRERLSCCSEFFQNQVVLYDSERNIIDYSEHYLPGPDDLYWTETLQTGRRSEKMLAETRKSNAHLDAIRTRNADYVHLGPGLPTILTYSFFENGKRLATITVADTNKPLSVYQLKLLDYICDLLSPSMFHLYSASFGQRENLRSVLVSILNKENVDPLVVTRCLGLMGWSMDDDYVLILIEVPEPFRETQTLTRYRHIYERLFFECIVVKYKDSLVMIIHNDKNEMMAECLPKLERQLNVHNAVCGLSFPFKSILQIGSHYDNADLAIQHGDKNERIRYLSDAIINPVISRIAADLPLYPLCHRETIRIYEYDRENATNLLLTLETYLMQYKSLKAAAEELFIHRNTMTYRLGCIEKIAHLNLEDSRERLHILLSCMVLRTLGDERQKE